MDLNELLLAHGPGNRALRTGSAEGDLPELTEKKSRGRAGRFRGTGTAHDADGENNASGGSTAGTAAHWKQAAPLQRPDALPRQKERGTLRRNGR